MDNLHQYQETEKLLPPTPANIQFRCIAFFLDTVLCVTFIFMLLWTFILPHYYPQEWKEFLNLMSGFNPNNNGMEELTQIPAVQVIHELHQTMLLMGLWLYYAVSEIVTQGSSLGKMVFKLKVIKVNTQQAPNIFETAFRSGTKTLCLLAFPYLTINFILAFFNRNKKSGHDFLSGTLVTEPTDTSLLKEIN